MLDLKKETRGEEPLKGLNAIIRTYSNGVATKDGAVSGSFADVQLDSRDKRASSKVRNPETGRMRKQLDNPDLHFYTSPPSKENPGARRDNGVFYSKKDMDKIVEVAKASGNYHERTLENADGTPRLDKEGAPIVEVICGVKADGMITPKSRGSQEKVLRLKTATLEASEFKVGPDAIKHQIEASKKAKAYVDTQRAAAREAKAAEKIESKEVPVAETEATNEAEFGE